MSSNPVIYVGFSKPKKFKLFSWLIRKFENIDYSHTYIKFYSAKYDRNLIYHASELRVSFWNEEVFSGENTIVREYVYHLSDSARSKIVQFAIDNVGEKYSFKPIVGLALRKLGFNFPSLFSTDKWYCVKLVAYVLEHAQLESFENENEILLKELQVSLDS